MVTRSEGLDYSTGQGYSALDAKAARDARDGYSVVSGLEVTTDGTNMTLDVSAGSATVGETSGSVDTVSLGSAGTITLDAADSQNPRKDTIYIDTTGTLQSESGTPEPADPSGNTRFNTYQPEPPYPSTEGTILAEVWVEAGASSISSSDVRDRRVPSEWVGDEVVAGSVGADEISHTHILDPDASDWGAAVNSKASEMSQGDVLFVPPVEYDCATTAKPDKFIGITGPMTGVRDDTRPHPTITKTADVPIIETQTSSEASGLADTFIALSNLRLVGSGTDTTPGAIIHGQCNIHNVTARMMGSHGIQLEQTSGDNLNGSKLNVAGRGNSGSLVWLGNDGSGVTKNTNACQINIQSSRGDTHAANIDTGIGNSVYVQLVESGGGVRVNDTSNMVRVDHSEVSPTPTIEFASGSSNSYGLVYYFNSASVDVVTDNGILNEYDLPFYGSDHFFHPRGRYTIDGSGVSLGGSVDTDAASTAGSTNTLIRGLDSGSGGLVRSQPSTTVGTTATAIYDFAGSGERSGLFVVQGVDGTARFSDLVHASRTSGTTTVINSEESGTPASRSYSIDTGTDSLDLAMASGTYTVEASGTQLTSG